MLRRAVLPRLASLGLLLSAGCTSGAGAIVGGSSTGGAGAPEDAPITSYQMQVAPIAVAPGVENTQCITLRLKNAEAGYVRRIHAQLTQGSHHMIAYRSIVQTEYPTPTDCFAFSGAFIGGNHPIFIAQQPDATLQLPTDVETGKPVGVAIDQDQMLYLELHYINTTDKPLEVSGSIQFDTVPIGSDVLPSDMAFWGTSHIDIAPNSDWSTKVLYQPAIAGTKTFAITTHQHHRGKRMRIWHAAGDDITSAPLVADGTSWANPPLEVFDPPMAHPDSGDGVTSSKGFAYQCEWQNSTPDHVGFGESANDEMCFLWHYYYPSQGFQGCIDGKCTLRSGDQ